MSLVELFSSFSGMKPLVSLFCVLCMLLRASCGYNETDLEDLRDLWFNAIKKTNESLLRQILDGNDHDHLIQALSTLEQSENNSSKIFDDVKTVIINNSQESIFGFKVGIFTNYCGPGDIAGPDNGTVCGMFNGADECCKAHDHCAHHIVSRADFRKYPNLPYKNIYYTSLSCECDVAFYNCLKQTKSIFAEIILNIYSVAQSSCFQHDYKVERCVKYDE